MSKKTWFWWGGCYLFLWAIVAFFSWGLVTPNLIFSQSDLWQKWQWWQWGWWQDYRHALTWAGLVLLILIFIIYLKLIAQIKKESKKEAVTEASLAKPKSKSKSGLTIKKVVLSAIIFFAPLCLAYNAFSADVFNYIFNAKMVVVYQSNPHQMVATDFSTEPMLKFLHNAHTPAPYGYVWTIWSLPWYCLGLGKFALTWGWFKVSAILSWLLTILGIIWLIKLDKQSSQPEAKQAVLLATLIFNPLLGSEIIMNLHNDLWMMSALIFSLGLMINWRHKGAGSHKDAGRKKISSGGTILLSALLLVLSIGVKFATLVAVPFWLWLLFGPELVASLKKFFSPAGQKKWLGFWQWWERYFFDCLALGFFLLLFLPRSQFFHPWYLVWALVWLPLCRWRWSRIILIAFSFSALARYLPWLWTGNYDGQVIYYQRLITWLGGSGLILITFISQKLLKWAHEK